MPLLHHFIWLKILKQFMNLCFSIHHFPLPFSTSYLLRFYIFEDNNEFLFPYHFQKFYLLPTQTSLTVSHLTSLTLALCCCSIISKFVGLFCYGFKWKMKKTYTSTVCLLLLRPRCSRNHALHFHTHHTFTLYFTMTVSVCNMINLLTVGRVQAMSRNFTCTSGLILSLNKFLTAM